MMLALANVRELPIARDSVDLIFTDPPYDGDAVEMYGWLAHEASRVLKTNGFALVMCGGYYLNEIMRLMDSRLRYFWKYEVLTHESSIVWPRRVIARTKTILAYTNGGGALPRTNVLAFIEGAGKDKSYHHWGQNVDEARYYIDTHSKPGDVVLDPFIGGGTTAVACELIGRRCIGFDIDAAAIETTRTRLLEAEIPTQALMQFAEAT